MYVCSVPISGGLFWSCSIFCCMPKKELYVMCDVCDLPKKTLHYDDFTETHYTAAILMAVSFNAMHKKCKASYSKTFEKERNCNRYRSTLQKCIKIQFFKLMHTNLLVIGNRGSENRRNILEIKITMLKRVKKFCDPRWSCNLSNTTIRRHCAPLLSAD